MVSPVGSPWVLQSGHTCFFCGLSLGPPVFSPMPLPWVLPWGYRRVAHGVASLVYFCFWWLVARSFTRSFTRSHILCPVEFPVGVAGLEGFSHGGLAFCWVSFVTGLLCWFGANSAFVGRPSCFPCISGLGSLDVRLPVVVDPLGQFLLTLALPEPGPLVGWHAPLSSCLWALVAFGVGLSSVRVFGYGLWPVSSPSMPAVCRAVLCCLFPLLAMPSSCLMPFCVNFFPVHWWLWGLA